MNEIQAKVAEYIKRAAPDVEVPTEENQLKVFLKIRFDELGLDSLDSMELVMEIEDHFGIMLDEEMVLACQGIGDLIDLVSTAFNGKS